MQFSAATARAGVEYLAFVIDDAVGVFGAHAASTQRMGGGWLVAHDRTSQRVFHVFAARLRNKFGELSVKALVGWFVLGIGPRQAQAVIVEREGA